MAFDIATSERKRAFSLPAGKAGASDILQFGHYLSVSPDGNKLAVVRWSDERQPHIEWRGVDGKGFGSSAVGPGLVQCLQWTKDGRSVLFARSQDGVRWQILRLGSDDGAHTFTGLEVTALTYFDLSPNGLRIAFDGTSYTLR